jgi:hypothetical protein
MSEDRSEMEVELLCWDCGREDPNEFGEESRSGDEVVTLGGFSARVGVDGSAIIGFALGPGDAIVWNYGTVQKVSGRYTVGGTK